MSRPSESPQISFRENTAPPRFAGLTIPSALRELYGHPENATATPRPSEMSALATRLNKIQLDVSPTKESDTRDILNPARLDFGEDGVGKENISERAPLGTAVWSVHDAKGTLVSEEKKLTDAGDYFKEGHVNVESQSSQTSGRGNEKEYEADKQPGEPEHQPPDEGPEIKHPSTQNSEANISTSTQALAELASDEPVQDQSSPDSDQDIDKQQFEGNLQKILDGKNKWPWLERCKAMSAVAESLSTDPAENLLDSTKSVLKTLSSKLNDHLDELRPSVITSALGLVNAIVSSGVDKGFDFAEEVFPSIMDLACGRSLTAQEAAKSLALVLHYHSEQQSVLEDADNIERLCDILQQQSSSLTNADSRERASQALEMAQKIAGEDENIPASRDFGTPTQGTVQTNSTTPPSHAEDSSDTKLPVFDDSIPSRKDSPQVRTPSFRGRLSGRSPVLSAPNSARGLYRSSLRLSRTPSRDESVPRSPSTTPRVGDASIEVRNGATVIRNAKLRGSVRKLSPGSIRNQRMCTDEELEEVRRKAMRNAKEEAARTHEKERMDLVRARDDLERKLRGETSQVEDLKAVLEEYQLAMQTMVAQGNTRINAQNTALVSEKTKLKAELLEVSESFETLKEKYEDSKKTVSLFEAKENRFVEQIKDLKRNMVELQKWSNDLKANTEKKLSKAFESVTSYRASYIDKEAHAEKAISDLERTKTELEREQLSHAETAAKFSQMEAQLHNEQDARSSAEASLATTKTSLSRITSQKERLQSDLDSTKGALSETNTKLLELESAASRVPDMQKQLDSVTIENRSLKARAYDDMTQIKSLEAAVKGKDTELEEMSAICEEAMERLERGKLN